MKRTQSVITVALTCASLSMASSARAETEAREIVHGSQSGDAVLAQEVALEASLEQMRAQLQQAQKAMQHAQAVAVPEPPQPPEPPEVPEPFGDHDALTIGHGYGGAISFNEGPRSAVLPLVVSLADARPETVGEIQEDLNIMSRILSKAVGRKVGQDYSESAMGIVINSFPGLRQPRSLYLEGYGAVFFIGVKFPLVPPPPPKTQTKVEKPVDTTWEQTKQELYGGGRSRSRSTGSKALAWKPPGGAKYDADKVEGLKKAVIESLKNASNLRHSKPDEHIVVAITGQAGRTDLQEVHEVRTVIATNTGEDNRVVTMSTGEGRSESTLVIKVKKTDADRFAKGELSLDEFQKTATVSTY